MSDISIPGVTSQFNTDKIIEDLMKLERIPLTRMEDSLETYKTQKSTWQSVNRRIAQFGDSAKGLFGFENPFLDRVAASSDESVLTATASRGTPEDLRSVQVNRLASADRFLSASLDADFEVPAGTYTYSVGDEGVSFSFSGGSLEGFASRLTDRGKGLISARVVNDTSNTQVMLIESLKTGAENTLSLEDDSVALGLSTGMFIETRDSSFTFNLDPTGVTRLGKAIEDSLFAGEEQTLRFDPGTEARLPAAAVVDTSAGLQLELTYRVENIPDNYVPPTPPTGPDIAEPGQISVEDIIIKNEPSEAVLPPWEPPKPPVKNTDLNVFTIRGDSGVGAPLPAISNSDGTYTITVDLQDYVSGLQSLDVSNKNTHKVVVLENAKVVDPNARGDMRPANPINQAGDAELELDGITVHRSENTIDDLLPGLTLNLHNTGSTPVQLSVEPDRENIKNSIINFVGYYNQLVTDIHVLTRDDGTIIDNLEYLTEEEARDYQEKLGLFQGDLTLNQLRSRLQTIMMNAYPGENDGDLVLLAQIGISTNASGVGGGFDANRMRGYLEISESALDQALETKIDQVRNLFGRDSDGDLVADTGIAVVTDSYVKPYTQSGGIIAMKIDGIERQMDRTGSDIETLNDRLERKEQDLQRQYATMEGALQNMEEVSRSIGNLNNNGNQ